MEIINKFKSKSIITKMTLAFISGFIIALLVFIILFFSLNAILDNYFLNSSYIKDAEEKYVKQLQQYVDQNSLSAIDSEALHDWASANGITIFSVSRERVLLYDNTYVGNAPLVETDSRQLHHIWQYFHQVVFADGEADVYVYKNFEKNYYMIADIVAVVISAFVWIGFFVLMVRLEANYILLLSQEVTAMREGTLANGFTQRGSDELNNLALALNQMQAALIEKENLEKQMRADQEKLVLGMAHDLRTPLTGLMGYLEVCKQTEADPFTSSYVEKAMNKAVQMRDLSDKLFEYFLSSTETPCSLEAPAKAEFLLTDHLSEMCAQLTNMGFHVTSDELQWHDVSIQVNLDYLGRIINNILSNLEKYADPGEEVSLGTIYSQTEIGVRIRNGIRMREKNIQGTRIGVNNITKMMQQMNGRCEVTMDEENYQITLWFVYC